MPLTEKDELFAKAIVGGLSNKQAAIAAGYSEKTASAAGSRSIKKPEVIDLIEHLKKHPNLTTAPPKDAPMLISEHLPNLQQVGTEEVGAIWKTLQTLKAQLSQANALESLITNMDEGKLGAMANLISILMSTLPHQDALAFMRVTMNNPSVAMMLRVKTAAELAKYENSRPAPKGIKEGELDAAMQAVGGGIYAPMAPPKPIQNTLDFDDHKTLKKYIQ